MEAIYYYKETNIHTVCLLRMFGQTGIASVPSEIDGLWVTEIGPYCFAPNGRYEGEDVRCTAKCDRDFDDLLELSGKAVEEVILPEGIQKIGANAFYNCRELRTLYVPDSLTEIGADEFMNCVQLTKIRYFGAVEEKSCLKQLLAQIPWDVEVSFENSNNFADAVLYFPEYFEGYDEIGPAHIFELNIQGEGFRARQCFVNGVIALKEYDDVFLQACARESVKTLCRMAENRIVFPKCLTEEHRQNYVDYLQNNQSEAAKYLLARTDISKEQLAHVIECLIQAKCFDRKTLEEMIAEASQKGNAELTTYLLMWKRNYFKESKQNRYTF